MLLCQEILCLAEIARSSSLAHASSRAKLLGGSAESLFTCLFMLHFPSGGLSARLLRLISSRMLPESARSTLDLVVVCSLTSLNQ